MLPTTGSSENIYIDKRLFILSCPIHCIIILINQSIQGRYNYLDKRDIPIDIKIESSWDIHHHLIQ